MTLFNWKKIVNKTQGRAKDIFAIMHWMTFMSLPSNRKDTVYNYMQYNFVGNSFAVDLKPLFFEAKNYTAQERIEYLSLLSYRSFAIYMHDQIVTLDLSHANVGQDAINNNRLLTLIDDKIHFKYEDI
jgi:hypothetical protein